MREFEQKLCWLQNANKSPTKQGKKYKSALIEGSSNPTKIVPQDWEKLLAVACVYKLHVYKYKNVILAFNY